MVSDRGPVPTQMCAECFHVLFPTQPFPDLWPNLVIYAHGQPKLDTHKPIPIGIDERVIEACDFCCADTTKAEARSFITTPFTVENWLDSGNRYEDNGSWTVCLSCTRLLIEAPDRPAWDALIARAVVLTRPQANLIGATTAQQERATREMVLAFKDHWTGQWTDPEGHLHEL